MKRYRAEQKFCQNILPNKKITGLSKKANNGRTIIMTNAEEYNETHINTFVI